MSFTVESLPPAPKERARPLVAAPLVKCSHSLCPGARIIENLSGAARVTGTLEWPCHPSGFVLFVRARADQPARLQSEVLARRLRADGLGTLMLDQPEGHGAEDPDLQATRLVAAAEWLAEQPEATGLPLGCLGVGADAAAALVAAGSSGLIGAVVSCGGRPDVSSERLSAVRAPTLLISGGSEEECLRLSYAALLRPGGTKWLTTIPGAGPRFEEARCLDEAARRASQWFVRHLVMEHFFRAAHRAAVDEPIRRALRQITANADAIHPTNLTITPVQECLN